MMVPTYMKMAVATIRASKLRSMLTMLGIIISVISVVMSISLAQGIKKDTSKELNKLGETFLTIRPGSFQSDGSSISDIDITSGLNEATAVSTLTEEDVLSVSKINGVTATAPMMVINGSIVYENSTIENGKIIATKPDLQIALQKEVEIGSFFTPSESGKPFVVLGNTVYRQLFGNETPLGSKIIIRGQEFNVVGVLKKDGSGKFDFGPHLDNAVYVPTNSAKALSGADARFQFIYVTISTETNINKIVDQINSTIKSNHGGEQDFAVVKQSDALAFTDNLGKTITTTTALIMSISLIVAGVGIMNIMLVSVTERTREIGIRKAVGATNKQILQQFFVEALVLSTLGGLVGLMISVLLSLAITAYTDITLVVQPILIAVALGVSVGVGAIFGIIPALQAAQKDPIEALRNE